VIFAIAVSVLALLRVPAWWARRRAARSPEVERLALDFQKFLGDVIAHGGLTQDRYLTDERIQAESELKNVAKGLHDRKLRKRVNLALAEYREAWVSSRPKEPFFSYGGDPQPTMSPTEVQRKRERAKLRARQNDAAQSAFDAFEAVLARVHELDRWATRPN
jgi:hypothetical protein